MQDFEVDFKNDLVLITVNMSRATFKEASDFKKIIDAELAKNRLKMLIDLGGCDFLDSTFIGVLVVTLKRLAELGGELRLVEPYSIAHSILSVTGTLNIFNVYKSKAEAIANILESTCA